ncbi:hypothetical protein OGAPHI_001268 [Ogataea philodendri]|uniref:Translation initiation factor eIF2B subunit gamma n=1 Tax=Ogataea philodendri TaxID=1378263 RepID=A0A9P8PGC7_9ASCO|nr:uncharacterized protein OGAPHI_001268 [Ogataea philodendri]KAH3670752.1 hypothetical protein OGAPHI_001268 [Ogataea philodendri]
MEFHAVIFCGKGSSLSPISAVKETGVPKALLPVANKPMIQYVLEWCDKAPFRQITIFTETHTLARISKFVDTYKESRDSDLAQTSPIECIGADASSTGVILNQYKGHILKNTGNFVLLPCDFITDVPPQVLVEVFRGQDYNNIGLSICYNNSFENIDANKVLNSNYTMYSKQNSQLVLLDLCSKGSVALSKFLKIRTHLLWRYPNTQVSTALLDSFIFFGDSRLFKLLEDQKNGLISSNSATKIKRDLARRSWKHSTKQEAVGLFILPEKSTFARCNNLAVYAETNRHVLKLHAKESNTTASTQKPKEKADKPKNLATVGADSLVGDNTELGERTSVKGSAIGNNCKIGNKCRLTACVVLDGVVIEDDVSLQNCTIGENARIGAGSRLVNCNIEGAYVVGSKVNLKGETLTNLEIGLEDEDGSFEAIDDDSDEDDSEDGESGYDDESFEEEEYDDDIFDRT